jgi:hypothetical protein
VAYHAPFPLVAVVLDKTLHSGSPGLRPSSVRWNIGADTVNRIVQPTV